MRYLFTYYTIITRLLFTKRKKTTHFYYRLLSHRLRLLERVIFFYCIVFSIERNGYDHSPTVTKHTRNREKTGVEDDNTELS